MTRPLLALVRHALFVAVFLAVPVATVHAHGPMGAPGGLPSLAVVLLDEVLHAKLGLSSGQEALWMVLDSEDATLYSQVETSRDTLRALVGTELAKDTPDLALIESVRANAHDAVAAATSTVDAAAFALYAILDAEQRYVVIATVKAIYAQRASRGSLPAQHP